jgi:hypothetical protein
MRVQNRCDFLQEYEIIKNKRLNAGSTSEDKK